MFNIGSKSNPSLCFVTFELDLKMQVNLCYFLRISIKDTSSTLPNLFHIYSVLLDVVAFLHLKELLTFSTRILSFYEKFFPARRTCYICVFRYICVSLDVIRKFLRLLRVTLMGTIFVSWQHKTVD